MKTLIVLSSVWLGCGALLTADEELPVEERKAKHEEGAAEVADAQDELSADVQQLVIEQTMPKVIELLNEVESIMDEATDRLAEADTGGATIAAQTEIIEKIHAAAKERQSKSSGSKSGGAMMDMMERMMGQKPGDQPGKGKGKGKGKGQGEGGDEGGEGSTGLSDSANDTTTGNGEGKSEARRIPKAAGNSNHEIPDEFKQALDAYNRGAEKKVK